ncbi:hypothetical protein BJ165DRAFT_1583387 [Panaeolus papilionaceus]|nr:hypothetical protein BJ165DRAFT_1583387 [Panaeolus papilionaceus]
MLWQALTYRDLLFNHDHVFMQDEVKFEHIIVTGKISIEPVTTKVHPQSKRFLLLGPTEAGKSSFVETIAGRDHELAISKGPAIRLYGSGGLHAYHECLASPKGLGCKTNGSGPVSVEDAPCKSPKELGFLIILMGPTGSGKSAFIEALSEGPSLAISKDQLEGYTQDVTAYQLNNVFHLSVVTQNPYPIWIVDTPGFLDRKISVMEIITKFNKWQKMHKYEDLAHGCSLCHPNHGQEIHWKPSTGNGHVRALAGMNTAGQITVVTTMWDTIHREDAIREANIRFESLQNGPWMDLIEGGSHFTRFVNTQESALHTIKEALKETDQYFYTFEFTKIHRISSSTVFLPNLISDLEGRVDKLLFQQADLVFQLSQMEVKTEHHVVRIIENVLGEVESDLQRFTNQLNELRAMVDSNASFQPIYHPSYRHCLPDIQKTTFIRAPRLLYRQLDSTTNFWKRVLSKSVCIERCTVARCGVGLSHSLLWRLMGVKESDVHTVKSAPRMGKQTVMTGNKYSVTTNGANEGNFPHGAHWALADK